MEELYNMEDTKMNEKIKVSDKFIKIFPYFKVPKKEKYSQWVAGAVLTFTKKEWEKYKLLRKQIGHMEDKAMIRNKKEST